MKKALLLLSFLVLLSPKIVPAQQTPALSPEKNVWVGLTIGPALSGYEPGLTGRATVQYASSATIYSLEYMSYSNFLFNPLDKSLELSAFGLMYGRIKRYDFFKLTFSAGLSLVKLCEGSKESYTFGLPLSARFILTPIRLVAVGVKLYARYIPGNSVAGVGFGFYFGKVR